MGQNGTALWDASVQGERQGYGCCGAEGGQHYGCCGAEWGQGYGVLWGRRGAGLWDAPEDSAVVLWGGGIWGIWGQGWGWRCVVPLGSDRVRDAAVRGWGGAVGRRGAQWGAVGQEGGTHRRMDA